MTFTLPVTNGIASKWGLEDAIDSAISAVAALGATGWPYYASVAGGVAAVAEGAGFITSSQSAILFYRKTAGAGELLAQVGVALAEERIAALEAIGAAGMSPKAAVACATTANITLSGEQVIDGVQTSGSRVLVKNQTTASQNGIYQSAAGGWVRVSDLDQAPEFAKASVFVNGGTTNAGRTYYQSATVTTLGTDAVTWLQASDQSALTKTVNSLDAARATLGPRLSEATGSRHYANGATATAGTNFGLTIPSGSSGAGSFVQVIWKFDGTGKAGSTVRLIYTVAKSATFTRSFIPTMQVAHTSGCTNRTATVTTTTSGATTVYTIDYVLQGDETSLNPYFTVGGAGTASQETVEVVGFTPGFVKSADPLKSAADLVLDVRADEALDRAVEATAFSAGEKVGTGEFTILPQYFNGATAITGGFRIPSGSTGQTSLVQGKWDIDGTVIPGVQIRMKMAFRTSATFTRSLTLTLVLATATGDKTRTSAATVVKSTDGDLITYEITYTLQGDEAAIKPYAQVSSTTATAAEETLVLESFRPFFLTAPAETSSGIDFTLEKVIEQGVRKLGDASYLFSVGDVKDQPTAWRPQVFNGAVKEDPYTVRIPAGQVGNVTILQAAWVPPAALEAGQKIKVKFALEKSATFTRVLGNLNFQVKTTSDVVRTAASTFTEEGALRIYEIDYTCQGDETEIKPYVQIQSGAAASVDETISLHSLVPYIVTSNDPILTPMDLTLAQRLGSDGAETRAGERTVAYAGIPAAVPDTRKTVTPSGGDYASPKAALDAISDAGPINRYEIRVKPGVYQDPEWFDEDYIDFIGNSRDECIIDFQQSNGASAADIAQYSAIYMRRTSRLEALTIRARNARYAIHLESAKSGPDRVQEIINCHIEHLGNDDAPANTWGSQNGIGSGLSSGQVVKIIDSMVIAKNGTAFSYHTNNGFVDPTLVEMRGSTFLTHNATAAAVTLIPIGSMQEDKCRMIGCVLGGHISYSISPWIPTTLDQQPANHCEIHLTGHGNTPALFKNGDWGEALRIDSATTGAASTVTISGSAVKWIFGDGAKDRFYTRKGSLGFTGAVWGWGDVSGRAVGPLGDTYITSLGQRLGNCTTTAKTLTVTVDGGAPITVTFDQDYTNMGKTEILSIINTALGSAATASTWKPGYFYRPHFSDEEMSLRNATGTGIPFGTVLAFDASRFNVRPMTSADPASLFAGVAWEDIETGKRGRVKTRGYLELADVLRSDALSVAFGDSFSIDAAKPGSVVKGGSQGLLPAIQSGAVRVG